MAGKNISVLDILKQVQKEQSAALAGLESLDNPEILEILENGDYPELLEIHDDIAEQESEIARHLTAIGELAKGK